MNMTPLALEPLMIWIPAAWLATLLLHAGLVKLQDPSLFIQHLAAYRVPDALLTPLSVALPLAEIAVGLGLLSPWHHWGAWGAASLLLLYAGVMAWHRQAGRQLDCGCGSEPLPLSWTLVLRNLALSLLCLPAGVAVHARDMQLADYAVTLGAVLLGSLLWASFHQVLRQARRLQPM